MPTKALFSGIGQKGFKVCHGKQQWLMEVSSLKKMM